MPERVEVDLQAVRFEPQPATVLTWSGMCASAFRFATGIEALRLTTKVGEIVVLPFRGQQIWDTRMHGRRLTMRSMFAEPQPTSDYLSSYGAFLIHCGITGMGGPGPTDTHPLHGELPTARFQTARLLAGEDANGPFLMLEGETVQARAFSHHYRLRSAIRLRPGSGILDISVAVENIRPVPLDLMYLAHINFVPVDGARLIDTVRDDRAGVELRKTHPAGLTITDEHQRLLARIASDPTSHRQLIAGQRFDPEAVLFLDGARDAAGDAHAVQLHPDGAADLVSWRPAELPVAVRWICRLGDQDALGLVLPSTSRVDGYTAEKAAGRIVTVPPGGSFSTSYRCGALLPAEAAKMIENIDDVIRRAADPQTNKATKEA